MLDSLMNLADQVCMFVVATGKALLPGFCAPLVDLYGQCVYTCTGMIRGIGEPNGAGAGGAGAGWGGAGTAWKGVAVAGAIGFGGIVAWGNGGQQQQQPLLGAPAAPASTSTATATAPVPAITASLPGSPA